MKNTIFSEIHEKRYTLAGEAPICKGELFNQFGYTANTPASKAVLNGMYQAPVGTDTATSDLFAEIAAIWKKGSRKLSVHNHKTGTIETVLENGEQGDFIIRVRDPF